MKKNESAHEGEIREIWKILKEGAAENRRTEKILRQVAKDLGGYTDTASRCLEDEFGDALRSAGRLGGSPLYEVHVRAQPMKGEGEYDLIGVNSESVFVGEIKHNLTGDKVRKFAAKKLKLFPRLFPATAKGREIRGMVGGAQIEADAANTARELGLYVLRLKNNRKLQVVAPD